MTQDTDKLTLSASTVRRWALKAAALGFALGMVAGIAALLTP